MARFGRIFPIAVVAAALGVATGAQTTHSTVQPQVDKLFNRWTKATPGCSVGADVNGEPVVRSAYGMADLEHDLPVTLDTIFEAGSVSKQFTATAVLLLARDGKLSLDDRASKYIPELPGAAAAVTIRQLLQHTAGLRDWGSIAAIAGWPRSTRAYTHAHVLEIISRQRALNFPPGTHWSYSNSGYNLAAILVSRVSGISFADFTKARIFDPLGMKDTSWRDDYTRIVKRRAIAYSELKGTFSTSMPFENVHGNGGLLTTVGDLLKWNANFAKPIVGDAALLDELQRRAVLSGNRTHEYALGLYVDTYRGVKEVDHSGGTAGYRAHLSRYPEQGVSIAVLCNAGSANPTNYAKAIADMLLTGLRAPTEPTATHTLTDAEAARLVGLYRSTHPAGAWNVQYDKQGLSVQFFGRLVASSSTRFQGNGGFTFDFDGRGQLRLTDEFGLLQTFDRVEPAKPSVDQLKMYAGRYFSEDADTTITAAIDGDRLVLRRSPDFTAALNPVYPDGFFSNSLGWVVFRRDGSGRPVSVSISQDRMWDLPFTRQPESARPK
jgi:CubicO group peptidase (beta-lactamase class C family)